ncbi:hypothetical protein GQ53DRAFT_745587 [Thozetella sp. PMI_491]|nr:hypothetical protein GQ53DRAFT_745587 [Thozetella sp. PMI_491]
MRAARGWYQGAALYPRGRIHTAGAPERGLEIPAGRSDQPLQSQRSPNSGLLGLLEPRCAPAAALCIALISTR